MRQLDLFSGIGGFALAAQWAGIETVAFCEIEPFCQRVLRKNFPGVPIFDDVKELTGEKICDLLNNKKQQKELQNWQQRQNNLEELSKSVNHVEKMFHSPLVLRTEKTGKYGNTAHGNAERIPCEERMDPMLEGENGCAGATIQTGKTELDMIGELGMPWLRSINGEERFSQEIITPARFAENNIEQKTLSTPIISSRGQNFLKEDLMCRTESRSAHRAIEKFTQKRGDKIDILTAGVPCQPASIAGKRRGSRDDRWLWPETLRIIREIYPRWILLENVYGLLSIEGGMALETTLLELESYGYSVQPFVIPACAVGAPHRRDRVWIVANTGRELLKRTFVGEADGVETEDGDADFSERSITAFGIVANTNEQGPQGLRQHGERRGESPARQSSWEEPWIEVASEFCRVYDGFSDFMDRCFDLVISEEDYVQIKRNGAESLPILWKAIQQEQIWERIRKQYKVEQKEILLSFLCRIEERTNRQNDICVESERTSQRKMRNLWINAEFRRSPQRREYQEQLARECANIVPQLPYEIALEIAKMWDYLSCAYSSSKTTNRVDRLRALGNAIVPQVAYRILAAIAEIEQMKGEK